MRNSSNSNRKPAFTLEVKKWANFYFFVQNLSNWHPSNRNNYNLAWEKEIGPFSEEELSLLTKFKEIRLKFKQAKSIFETSFFVKNKPLETLKKELSTNDFEIIKNIFLKFQSKFEYLYETDSSNLKIIQNDLNVVINDGPKVNKITDLLSQLYNSQLRENINLNIYLLLSAGNTTGGGANIDEKSISVEVSRWPIDRLNHVESIIWHEVIHLLFQGEYFYPKLLNFTNNDYAKTGFLSEIVATLLLPKGIIGEKLFNNGPLVRTLFNKISEQQTTELLLLAKNYLNSNKSFDEDFIVKVDEVCKQKEHRRLHL